MAESDILDDPSLYMDPFFKDIKCCWLLKNPRCILRVRNQGRTNACYAFVATATIYADEVLHRGNSSLGSPQEFLDYIHRYERPMSIKKTNRTGPYDVPAKGFTSSFSIAFGYVYKHRLSTNIIYPWSGSTTFRRVENDDWDGIVIYRSRDGDRVIHPVEKISIERYEKIPLDSVEKVLNIQPITGCVNMTRSLHKWRSQEIFKGSNEEIMGKHAVTIVGCEGKGENAFYLCQNSYGMEWGYKGYVKIKKGLVSRFYKPIGTCSPENRKEGEDASIPSTKGKLEDDVEHISMGSSYVGKRKRETNL